MHRTQISLEERQYERLAQEAGRLGISLSELIRRLISQYFKDQPDRGQPLDRIAGIAEGTSKPVGREHNRYLYDKEDQ